uniref:Ras homolog family member D n=1 Tax=Equus asinus TaxID=9793 RepID=A0A9L0KL40_EQUAS
CRVFLKLSWHALLEIESPRLWTPGPLVVVQAEITRPRRLTFQRAADTGKECSLQQANSCCNHFWYPEVNHFCKEVPIILVGCKTDLRKDKSLVKKLRKNKLEPVTYHRGQEMARSVGAVAYLECSALLHENVHAVFQEAAKVALSSRSRNLWRRITRSFCVVT